METKDLLTWSITAKKGQGTSGINGENMMKHHQKPNPIKRFDVTLNSPSSDNLQVMFDTLIVGELPLFEVTHLYLFITDGRLNGSHRPSRRQRLTRERGGTAH